jgi:hypothetical protein
VNVVVVSLGEHLEVRVRYSSSMSVLEDVNREHEGGTVHDRLVHAIVVQVVDDVSYSGSH